MKESTLLGRKNVRWYQYAIAIVILVAVFYALFYLLAYLFMWLWNGSLPYLTVTPFFAEISHNTAFNLLIFLAIFFGLTYDYSSD